MLHCAESLSLAKMPSGLNAFEISDIQEEKTVAGLAGLLVCNNVTLQLKTTEWSFCGTHPESSCNSDKPRQKGTFLLS
jgi:hypothetical protein